MPYKVNGKFVSKAVFEEHEAAQAAKTREENEVSENEYDVNDETVTEEKADKRRGERPTTTYKKALNKKTAAEVKLLKAQAKRDAYDSDLDALDAAVSDAQDELEQAASDAAAAYEAL